jgi:hypothetical protein
MNWSAGSFLRRVVFGCGLLATTIMPVPCLAAPAISRIMPPAGQRGGECEVTVTGSRLDEATELFFEDGLIEQVGLEQPDGGTIKVKLRIPADCPLGDHRIRVRTPAGLSELRTFAIVDSPVRIEQETAGGNKQRNDSQEAAEVVVLEGGATQTVAGVARREDVDTYRVSLKAGEKISASLRGVRLNHTPFDPAVELVDENGFVIAACDDHPLLQQDAMISARVERDGNYFLRVRESAYLGDDNSFYLLHIGRFPAPLVGLPPGGKPGETLSVEWLGDSDGAWKADITLPKQLVRRDIQHDGIFNVAAVRDGVASAEGVPFRLSPLPAFRETEPNNEPTSCQTFPAPSAAWGQLQQDGDIDWMRFEAAAGSKWHVRAWGRRLGSPIDITLNAYQDNDKRQRITGNDDSAGPDSAMTVTVPKEGSFLVRVSDHQDRGGETFVWWIEATPVEPQMQVSVPPAATKSQQRLIAQVPRGNRVALVVNASRTDISENVQPRMTDLPNGVQATPTPLPSNSPSSLLVFEAANDAELAATMAAVELVVVEKNAEPTAGSPEGGKAEEAPRVIGGLQQPTELVHGNPNRTCWRQSFSDRLPVSVVAAVPVEIDLVEPAVPLVQSGRLDLRVKIKRDEGFDGAIRLTFPFRPPGVGAASGVNVPADASEVVYPINANDKAAIGPWGVVVTATVTPKGELAKTRPSFEISTRPVTLNVSEPMLQLAVDRAAGELGSEVLMVGKLAAAAETSAKAMLLGLPAKCSVKEVAVSPGDTEVTFPITVPEDAPVGKHGSVVCELHVPQNEDWVIHKVKAGELRIDKPLPAPTKVAEKKPVVEQKPAEPKPKVLSRRERLREQARVIAAAGVEGSKASGAEE